MSNHVSDDLPRLLTGDATRDVVMQAAAHLRTCVDCQQELVSAVIAHAALTSAHRFAPEIVAPGHDVDDDLPDVESPVGVLPDLSGVFAEARADAAKPTTVTHLPQRRRLVAVAAAAAVLVGGGATYAVVNSGSTSQMTRTVALQPYGIGQARATVKIVGNNTLQVDASKLPKLDKKHLYEVWLTDRSRTNMQSVGFIGDGNVAKLPVSSKWMSQYKAIEVSVQPVNEPNYSGTSVLRGNYG